MKKKRAFVSHGFKDKNLNGMSYSEIILMNLLKLLIEII